MLSRGLAFVLALTLLAAPGPSTVFGVTPPADCSQQDLSERTTKSGWVTVVYDDHNLVDPAVGAAAADYALTIAQAIRDEANEAIVRYSEFGLGQYVAPDITIELRCAIVVLPTIHVPAYTPGPALIQIDVNRLRAQLAPVVVETAKLDADPSYVPTGPVLSDGIWKTAKYEWADTVHHEVFHALQWNMVGAIDFLIDYVRYLDHTRYESGATLGQDLFGPDGDDAAIVADDLGENIPASYTRSVRQLFREVPKTTIDQATWDRDSAGESRAYQAAAILQYWAERFGDLAIGDLEARAARFLERLTQAPGHGPEAMEATIGSDVYGALLDFFITAYARKRGVQSDLRYRFLDEQLDTNGVANAAVPDYPDVLVADADIRALADATLSDQEVAAGGGRLYEITLPAGTELVRLKINTHVVWGTFASSAVYLAAIPVDVDATGAEAALIERRNRWQGGADVFVGFEDALIPVSGYEKLAVVAVASEHTTRFDLVVEDAGPLPAIEILSPTSEARRAIGPANDLQQLEVRVAGVGAPLLTGLGPASFEVLIGGVPVTAVEPVALPDGSYELTVQPAGPLSDGVHDLLVRLGGSTALETSAVIVGESPHAALAIVIDNSGSMAGTKITEAKSAAVSFVERMELGDQVAVVTFNSSATVRQALITLASEATRDQVIAAIQAITAGGGTSIGSGINAGNTQLGGAQAGFARAQLMLSDGFDGTPALTESAIQNTPQDVDIHTIALTTDSDQQLLRDIASRTGGTFLFAPSASDLGSLYQLIRAAIGSDEISADGTFGAVSQGQTESTAFMASAGSARLTAILDWSGSDFNLTLTSPSGRVITETTSDPDVSVSQGPEFVAIEVTGPEAGQWQLSATGVDVPSPEEVTYRVEESGTPLRSKLYLTDAGEAGQPIDVRLLLTERAAGIGGATATATVTDPLGAVRAFPLFDDGGHGDGRADDGLYGASLMATDAAGSYTIQVTAAGTDSTGGAFNRFETASTFLAAKIDADADGIADAMETRIGLSAADPNDGLADHDDDGIATSQELRIGTSPFDQDSDDGGERDGSEVAAARDPLLATDDAAPPVPFVDAHSVDGSLIEVAVATNDGLGSVRLRRLAGGSQFDLGTHPGSGTTLTDGPLAAGDYWYEAVAVAPNGAESAARTIGPIRPAADVTPPVAMLSVNGGTWATTSPTVSVAFFNVSEPLADMRLAESAEALASTPWVPYLTPTTFTVGPAPGVHVVYAQVRDPAGNPSPVVSGVVNLVEGGTERVSVSSQGDQDTRFSSSPSISSDGRYVAFSSDARNLVPGDTNNTGDVFVRDRQTGTTSRVSVASDGAQGNNLSGSPSISADGRYVAFDSSASNLVPGDTNAKRDIFVHDRQTGTTSRVSVSSSGTQAAGSSYDAAISADGRYVAFESEAKNLVSGDKNNAWDAFVHDRQTGTTSRVSVSSSGTEAKGVSLKPAISADGRYVAFESDASNLVSGDTNNAWDVFVRDRQTGTTSRVSVSSSGTQASGFSASISGDGRYVAFESGASNLVPGDTNAKGDVFVRDRQTGTTSRVSIASDGTQASGSGTLGGSRDAAISADGRYVAFESDATNLVSGDTNSAWDVFVHDRQTPTTNRVSVASDGTQGNGSSGNAAISAVGGHIAFESYASNLVLGDTNGVRDVFVRAT